jgi:hypothetical protein
MEYLCSRIGWLRDEGPVESRGGRKVPREELSAMTSTDEAGEAKLDTPAIVVGGRLVRREVGMSVPVKCTVGYGPVLFVHLPAKSGLYIVYASAPRLPRWILSGSRVCPSQAVQATAGGKDHQITETSVWMWCQRRQQRQRRQRKQKQQR